MDFYCTSTIDIFVTDNLGSICAITTEQGQIIDEQKFDAWGNHRPSETWSYMYVPAVSKVFRGYKAHEMLPEFELINMNGRVYDPIIARFLSPDPGACPAQCGMQAPSNTQSFNRYSYCWNNPLGYTDPSGEIIGSIFTAQIDLAKTVFTKGGLEFWNWNGGDSYVGRAWKEFDPTASWSKTNKAMRIDAGLFLQIPIPGWETTQTLIGNVVSHARNITGNVDNVEIYRWTVLVNGVNENDGERWGFTLGPYINSQNIEIGLDIYLHEYGHTIQSRILGPLYLTRVAIPSGLTAYYSYDLVDDNGAYHENSWYEIWANRLAGVPESDEYSRDFRNNSFWYWLAITVLPLFPN